LSVTPGTTPGLRIPLSRTDGVSYVLTFGGPGEHRPERITFSQLMTLVSDAAEEVGLSITVSGKPHQP
jgi:hypothetical protein